MRLTRLGRRCLVGAVLVLLGGTALGSGALVGAAAGAVALTALATALVAEVPRIEVARAADPPEVDRGSPAGVTLTFIGRSRRSRPFTVLETVAGERRTAEMPALSAGHSASLTYDLDTSRRGRLVTGPLVLRRTDPLGLVVAERAIGSTSAVAVRPRRHHLRMLPTGRMRDLEGPTREISEGHSSFHQLREYVPGDDLRRIHWRSSARTGTLVVKQLVDTTRPEVVVILDNRASAIGEDDFEQAVEVAASVLAAAENDGFPTSLLFADGRGDVDEDGNPVPHIEHLTVVQRSASDSLVDIADALRARGRSLVFVTGELDAVDIQLLARIARGFSPAYAVSVVAERRAPFVAPPGVVTVAARDAEEFAAEWSARR